ncbi:MAG: hypothetical protein HN919_21840 [Verrucomicrobia bacterium]|jgi:hypothetical protein|nr:hypothetical protein [Verrucomicrobiota bacterium]MBT7068954.1 hypothetical protein [Verrucomicrobiota bacterium]MBT7701587.1 hypothetical protein [Verrucomicrobiota bacterium]
MRNLFRLFLVVLMCSSITALTGCDSSDGGTSAATPYTIDDVATTAARNLGVAEGANAILLAAGNGHAWVVIIESIMTGVLRADGTISGLDARVLPRRLADARISILDLFGDFEDSGVNAIVAILQAAQNGYNDQQIILAIQIGTLRGDGFIFCVASDYDLRLCESDSNRLVPANRAHQLFRNPTPPDLPDDDGYDESYDSIEGEWTTTGTCEGGESTGFTRMEGTTTLRPDGVAWLDWQYFRGNEPASRYNGRGDWSYTPGRLTLDVSATYTGAARPEFTAIVLRSETCWGLRLTRPSTD